MIRRLALALLVCAVALMPIPAKAASGTVMPSPFFVGFTDTGAICAACKLYTYVPGTTTNLATYSDSALTSANANPVVLDSAGRATVFLSATSYKFVLKTAADVTIWTQDNVSATPFISIDLDITGTAGEALSAGDAVYISDGSGGNTAGRWYKTDADNTYSSTTAQALGFAVTAISSAASGSIRIQGRVTGLSALAAGSVYYISATAGALTSSAPANSRPIGVADSTTSLVISSGLTSAAASATQAGIVSLGTQTLGTGTKSVDKLTYKPGGVTTFDANASGRILGPFITSRDTSGTAETSTIATAPTIKANTLNASGDVLRATYVGISSANAQLKTWTVKLGGTTITTKAFTPNATAASWRLKVEILRTGTATQIITTEFLWSENLADSNMTLVDVVSGTKDLTTDLTLDVTMTNAVAGTITFKGAWFEVIGS